MARITTTIEADTPEEYHTLVSALFNSTAAVAVATGDAPAGGARASGRPRKADAAQATNASGGQQQASTLGDPEPSGSASGQSATATASPSDLLPGAEPVLAVVEGAPTKEAVTAAMSECLGLVGALKTQEALAAAGLAGQISKIDPKDYGKAMETLQTIIATN